MTRSPDGRRRARDLIDPDTGHRVIRLSPDEGGSSLYFHQRGYTPEGDKIVIRALGGIATVDLSTLGVSTPSVELVLADVDHGQDPTVGEQEVRGELFAMRDLQSGPPDYHRIDAVRAHGQSFARGRRHEG